MHWSVRGANSIMALRCARDEQGESCLFPGMKGRVTWPLVEFENGQLATVDME